MFKTAVGEANHLVRRWQTVVALLMVVGFMIQGFFDYRTHQYLTYYPGQYSAYVAYLVAFGMGAASYWVGVLPLVACLIAGDSLAWDRGTGSIRFVLARISRTDYIRKKILSVNLASIFIMVTGYLLSFLTACLWFPVTLPRWHRVGDVTTLVNPAAPINYLDPFPTLLHDFFFDHPLQYIVLVTCIALLSALFWVNMSLLVSLWTTRMYLVLCIPWLVYIVVTFVLASPVLALPNYTPLVLSGPFIKSGSGPGALWIFLIWPIALVLVMITLYASFVQGKGKDILD